MPSTELREAASIPTGRKRPHATTEQLRHGQRFYYNRIDLLVQVMFEARALRCGLEFVSIGTLD